MQPPSKQPAAAKSNEPRRLSHLEVHVDLEELIFARDVFLYGGAPVDEVIKVMEQDDQFLNPTVERGLIRIVQGKPFRQTAPSNADAIHVIAEYGPAKIANTASARVVQVVARYDDDTTETLIDRT